MLLILEVAFALALVVGVGWVYAPAGLILLGILGVLACEVAAVRRAQRTPEAGEEP